MLKRLINTSYKMLYVGKKVNIDANDQRIIAIVNRIKE
jgi:hypothetical protein